MKILMLTRYSRLGASSRLRFYQYLPYLNELGWTITIEPLLEDNYIADLYNNRSRDYRLIFTSYWRRLKVLTTSSRYDILWIEKELFPMLPSWFEELLGIFKIPYVVDFDDAIFHNYDSYYPVIHIRPLYKGKNIKISGPYLDIRSINHNSINSHYT
jgi:hypothetical protein